MTTPVSSTLAKLLKEKGFDVPVRNYYLLKEEGNYLHEGFEDNYWGDNRIVNWNKDVVGIKPFKGFISAPTIAEVVMWLYETHGIWIQTPFSHNDVKPFCWSINKTIRNISEEDEDRNCWLSGVDTEDINGWDSPAEATSEAIYFTLKKLL